MGIQKLSYILCSSVRRVVAKPGLFASILLSLSIAMLVPLLCTALVETLLLQQTTIRDKYTAHTYAWLAETKPLTQEDRTRVEETLCETGVLATLLSEYVILSQDDGSQEGRFMPVQAATADTVSLLYPDISPLVHDVFSAGDNGCILDRQTAVRCGVTQGDHLLVRGETYRILAIAEGAGGSVLCIPYAKLSPQVVYPHTLYLLLDAPREPKEIRKTMATLLPDSTRADVIAMEESFQSREETVRETLATAVVVTVLYLLYAVVSIAVIRYGEVRVNQTAYAVALAVGGNSFDLVTTITLEATLLIPLALVVDSILLKIVESVLPIPYSLSLSPVSLGCSFLFAFLCSLAVACIVTKKITGQPCAALLKEV